MGIVFDTRRYGRMRVESVPSTEHQYLQDFENRGGIRIHMNRDGKYGTIEMAIKPTADQKKKLRSFIGAVGGNVDIDFMDENYNTAHSASYEGVSPARVLSGITSFYDEGIKPKGNVSESYSVSLLTKSKVEEIFGGIWLADKKEFAKFASAVRKSPFEKDGEGIAYTDNYFYAYYRNIDGMPIPYVSVYLNEEESQDVVNQVNQEFRNARAGERIKKYIDRAISRAWDVENKGDANDGDNSSSSLGEGNGVVDSNILRTGRYYDDRGFYYKASRANKEEYDEIDSTSYSINRDGIATPEMVAEANEELTESQKAAKVIADEIEVRIKKIAQSKELTFEQIELPSPIVGYRKQYLWGYMTSTP